MRSRGPPLQNRPLIGEAEGRQPLHDSRRRAWSGPSRRRCGAVAGKGTKWLAFRPGGQGTGRRGPVELWDRFDAAVQALNHAITGTNVVVVARAFGELASAAGALADAVETEDRKAASEGLRQQAG